MSRNAEARVQAAIVDYLRTVAPHCRTASVPNGGLRAKAEAALLKWTGVLPGMTDLVLIAPGGRIYCIEIKTGKGRLSPEQEDFRAWCLANAVPWMTARSIDDVREALVRWRIDTREAAQSVA